MIEASTNNHTMHEYRYKTYNLEQNKWKSYKKGNNICIGIIKIFVWENALF